MRSEQDVSKALSPALPATSPNLSSHWRDLGSGLCVAGLLLPEAVAYAGLANLPVVHALTATMVGLAIYAFFGGSRFAIVAPTSSTATLSAAAAVSMSGTLANVNSVAYTQAVLALVLLTGVMLVVLALARQGQLSSFISRPVLRGFAFGLAVTIVVKQLPDALGFVLPREAAPDPAHVLLFAVTHLKEWHIPSIAVAMSAALLLAGLRRWPQVPASMLVIVLAISAAYWLNLQALGVHEIGSIQRPAMHLELPDLPFNDWLRMAELAFGLSFLFLRSHGAACEPWRCLMAIR